MLLNNLLFFLIEFNYFTKYSLNQGNKETIKGIECKKTEIDRESIDYLYGILASWCLRLF
jgi:hypothetical protein